MSPHVYLSAATMVVVLIWANWFAYNRIGLSHDQKLGFFNIGEVGEYEVVPLMDGRGVGPESFAFDLNGDGPYTGVSDGRIIKWDHRQNRWLNFSLTSPLRNGCGDYSESEETCGRPLGLCFGPMGHLYIADAYLGLLLVGPNGGIPTTIARGQVQVQLQGSSSFPFTFTNSLDIDHATGLVYFTFSSSTYQRRNYISLILSGDKTGRLMKYEPESKQVSVILENLSFANGVALSQNGDYILVVETTKCRILRYWLKTQKAGTLEVFAQFPGFPDNIKRSPRGGFWVGIYSRQDKLSRWVLSHPWIGKSLLKLPLLDITKAYLYLAKIKGSKGLAMRVSEEGKVVEIVEDHKRRRSSVSEVEERDGTLWVGSVDAPFVAKYKIPSP